MAKKRLLCVLIMLLVFKAGADQIHKAEKREFYYDRERGWYFYEVDPKKEEKAEDKKESEIVHSKPVIDWKAVQTMHPTDFNKLIEDVKDYAIMYPSEANVRDFYKLQSIALDRSRAFMETSMSVVQSDPDLSRESRYPASKVGQDEYFREKRERIDRVLRENADNYALLYFYSPECGYCAKQAPILQSFIDDTGWTVKPVDISTDSNAVARFNIQSTPSLVLIQKGTKDWKLISSGLLPLPDIKERVFRVIGK
ncbi:conjugal transfer protein TraF [Seleniivibrio woodruffii]|nr:conjugal transfer protein TraF [Seleniivibrio woodruffii]